MDEETHTLFQRLAGQLGWTKHGDLNVIEAQLQQRIEKSRQPLKNHCKDATMDLHSESEESPKTCDSCVCKLLLFSSEDEAESWPKITPESRQEGHDECAVTKQVDEKPQNHGGTIAISDSSTDDDFEICPRSVLTQMRTLNSNFTARRISRTKNKRSDCTFELNTDSSGDEGFEKFLTRVKIQHTQSQKRSAWKKNDDSLKDFIVSDSSLDDLDVNGIVETKHSADTERPEPIRRSHEPASKCSVEAVHRAPSVVRSVSPVLNNSEDDFVIKNTKRGQLLDKQKKKKSEQPSSCTWGMLDSVLSTGPMRPEGDNPSHHPTDSKQLNQMSNPSDTSSDEFESLIERIKNKTLRTPAPTSSNLNGKRIAVTEPVKQKPTSKRLGIKHKPTAKKSFVTISTQPSKPMKGILSELTSVNQVPDFKLPSVSESQSQHGVRRRCQTPGCFLQDLTLSSSKYVKNFKQNREELTQELYNLYNKSVFQQKLPEKLEITWNKKMRKTAGYCVTGQKRDGVLQRYARIELSEKVCDSAERLRDTLIHELCHAATWLINNVRDGHGPFWKLYAQKSILIHPELPLVTRCHTYEINYKYTYQCSRCKNTIGRHSKSLDTQRFVCALCKGPLMLLTNMMKDGTPAKKELAPFAKFVKENYSSTKKEHKGLQHAEVMRKLSADFAKKTQISDF